jgi:nucleotide-binding universal stress UspA family protein
LTLLVGEDGYSAEEVTAQEAIPTTAVVGISLVIGVVVSTTSTSVSAKIKTFFVVVCTILAAYFTAYKQCRRALIWLVSKFKGKKW